MKDVFLIERLLNDGVGGVKEQVCFVETEEEARTFARTGRFFPDPKKPKVLINEFSFRKISPREETAYAHNVNLKYEETMALLEGRIASQEIRLEEMLAAKESRLDRLEKEIIKLSYPDEKK
jgi:hypothetical protein